ncbi:tetraacyldisaccharide 4'-kinase [Halanaerobium hydrogeniformans]|uniref:Tetraacyldisaccharide 4'-kinase n=1 Tax=Halanaerobium hydrogeniformans TaxID=656519 RepID=E4RJY1_HALHG|nr:tetraacyldisaccharide 4'-kinase [Halanaerobium hydrogeniformans]ADQ15551.1 tetraacyldisaccharide 4'-kinase [Halanaerobium hydrogeniformans]
MKDNLKSYLKRVIKKEETGKLASITRVVLLFLSYIYSAASRMRSFAYRNKLMPKKEASVPVISVGNITTGGTGKTPFTAFLLEQLKHKYSIAVISRGYGASKDVAEPFLIKDGENIYADSAQSGDELFMLARKTDDVIFIRSADRYQGTVLAEEKGAELIILDDGFQHYQLEREVDVVIIDAEDPFSNNKVLPAGLLREPFSALKRADIFILNHTENVEHSRVEALKKDINKKSPANRGVFAAKTISEKCISVVGEDINEADFLEEKRVFAFSGIGSPEAFKRTIESNGGNLVSYRVFKDHYNYQKEDLLTLVDQYESSKADIILTTEKDAVKLFDFGDMIGELPFYYLTISMQIDDSKKLLEAINEKIQQKRNK